MCSQKFQYFVTKRAWEFACLTVSVLFGKAWNYLLDKIWRVQCILSKSWMAMDAVLMKGKKTPSKSTFELSISDLSSQYHCFSSVWQLRWKYQETINYSRIVKERYTDQMWIFVIARMDLHEHNKVIASIN